MITRRGIITGLISLAAAPAVVRASSLMRCAPTTTSLLDRWTGMTDWSIATPDEIYDDIRRVLAIAWQVPEHVIIGPPATTRTEAVDIENFYSFIEDQTKHVG